MGAPFLATRKAAKDELPKSKKKLVKYSKRQYLNSKNDYEKFSTNKARIKILKNYKEINKILMSKTKVDKNIADSNDSLDPEEQEKRYNFPNSWYVLQFTF